MTLPTANGDASPTYNGRPLRLADMRDLGKRRARKIIADFGSELTGPEAQASIAGDLFGFEQTFREHGCNDCHVRAFRRACESELARARACPANAGQRI